MLQARSRCNDGRTAPCQLCRGATRQRHGCNKSDPDAQPFRGDCSCRGASPSYVQARLNPHSPSLSDTHRPLTLPLAKHHCDRTSTRQELLQSVVGWDKTGYTMVSTRFHIDLEKGKLTRPARRRATQEPIEKQASHEQAPKARSFVRSPFTGSPQSRRRTTETHPTWSVKTNNSCIKCKRLRLWPASEMAYRRSLALGTTVPSAVCLSHWWSEASEC